MKKAINLKTAMKAFAEYVRVYSLVEDIEDNDPDRKAAKLAQWHEEKKETYEAVEADASFKALEAEIDRVQENATVRLIDANRVLMTMSNIEKMLRIPKKAMEGVVVYADLHAEKLPNAYKWPAYSTQFTAEYRKGAWRVTDICRDRLERRNMLRIVHTDASKVALLERFTHISRYDI